MSADDIIGLYERKAHAWVADRGRQTVFFERDWLDRFTALIPRGGTILDLGCGAGKPMAAYLLPQGFNVCGVDSSAAMIGMAKANFPSREWIITDMRKLALNRSFDGVMAWDSFFHLDPDAQRRMFPIFYAHAKPGAPLLFTSGPRHGEAIGNLHGEPLYHASLAPEEYRALLATAGFTVIDARMEDPACGGHSIWLARREEAE
jgi:SAM-dependent methyltransferase